jgi:replicative DNA helicase
MTGAPIDKSMPSSPDSERVILGAILLDNTLISQAIEILKTDDFFSPLHRKIFSAMRELFAKSERIDPIMIAEEIKSSGTDPNTFGGAATITNLTYGLPHFSSIDKYAGIITEKSKKRRLAKKLSRTVGELLNDEREFSSILTETESDVFGFSTGENAKSFEHIHQISNQETEILRHHVKNNTMIEPVLTGFRELDEMLGTLEPELIIIGARPSIGKTSFAINIAEEFALNQKKTVAFFSLEMSKKALTDRIICSRAGIPAKRYKLKNITQAELEKAEQVDYDLATSNLFINDQSDITPIQILSKCRKLRIERKKLDLIVIDYLQMLQASHRIGDLRERITEVSKELAQIKKDLNVPILAVASLSRASETGTVRKPRASDLRESGQIESDADQIWLLHRQGHYDPNCATPAIAELDVVKNRNGETGNIQLIFQKEFTRFRNLAKTF